MSNDGVSYLPCLDYGIDREFRVNTESSLHSADLVFRRLFGERFTDQLAQFSGKSLRIHRVVCLRRGMSVAIGSPFSFHVVASSLFVGVK